MLSAVIGIVWLGSKTAPRTISGRLISPCSHTNFSPHQIESSENMTVVQHRVPVTLIQTVTKKADDEASVCSTLTVERVTEKRKLFQKKACTVRFNIANNVEHESPDIYDDEVEELWHTKAEYKEYKRSFIDLAKQFQSYDRKISDPQSFKASLIRAFKACCDGTEDLRSCMLERSDEKALRSWLSKGSRRGLERISVLTIFADKSSRRKKICAAVLDAQESSKEMEYEARAELIRDVAERISRPSRQFAWRLAF